VNSLVRQQVEILARADVSVCFQPQYLPAAPENIIALFAGRED
jgi:hypothetical protein